MIAGAIPPPQSFSVRKCSLKINWNNIYLNCSSVNSVDQQSCKLFLLLRTYHQRLSDHGFRSTLCGKFLYFDYNKASTQRTPKYSQGAPKRCIPSNTNLLSLLYSFWPVDPQTSLFWCSNSLDFIHWTWLRLGLGN